MTRRYMDCDGCVFQERNSGFQSGCVIHKTTPTLIESKKLTDDGSWILEGLCQYKRDKSWQYAQESWEEQVKEAKKEAQVTFDLSFPTVDEVWAVEQFEHIKSFLNGPHRMSAVYSNPQVYMENLLKGVGKSAEENRVLLVDPNIDWRVKQGRESKTTYFACMNDFKVIPNDFLYWLDIQINENGYRFAMASSNDDVLLSTAFFKKVQVSIDELRNLAVKYDSHISLDTLIDMCNLDKNWNKEKENWI